MGKVAVGLEVLRLAWDHPGNRRARTRALIRTASHEFVTRALGLVAEASLEPNLTILGPPRSVVSMVARGAPPHWHEMMYWDSIIGAGDMFIDIGANIGLYSLWAAARGAEVIAVEPSPVEAAFLRLNLARNGLDAEVVEAVVTRDPGTAQISRGRGVENRVVSAGGLEVPAVRLDDLVLERDVRGVKIDVEGAERLVLEGAQATLLDRRVHVFQIEWNSTSVQNYGETREGVAEILRDAGYHPVRPRNGALLPASINESDDDLFWTRDAPIG